MNVLPLLMALGINCNDPTVICMVVETEKTVVVQWCDTSRYIDNRFGKDYRFEYEGRSWKISRPQSCLET